MEGRQQPCSELLMVPGKLFCSTDLYWLTVLHLRVRVLYAACLGTLPDEIESRQDATAVGLVERIVVM